MVRNRGRATVGCMDMDGRKRRLSAQSGQYALFFAAVAVFGFSQSVVDATLNNFLAETFSISEFQRGFMELPREMPGFLVIFLSALFFFVGSRRLAALANALMALGIILLGLFSVSFPVMLLWLFVFSSGQHLFLPLTSSIGMEFAADGKAGSRLGQLSGSANLAAIVGGVTVFAGFNYLGFTFVSSFMLAAAGFFAASVLIFIMTPDEPRPAKTRFLLRKEYGLFYWLNILYGTRKQLFITFAPWVLVTVFHQKTQVVATLLAAGGVIGIVFKPLLGRAIDRLGERRILMAEAVALVAVCLLYGFSRDAFGETAALYVTCACYVVDQLLMSVGMARATYLKKIAVEPADVTQTLTMGVTIDHFFSIAIALVSGWIWLTLGYQYVFLLGAVIALVNLFSASRVRTPG